jgi:hypothetical protein
VLVFLYAKIAYASSARHYGHLLVLFVAMCWLAPTLAGRDSRTVRSGSHRDPTEGRAALLTVVLGLQCVAGAFAVATDWTTPFSDGRAVADHLTATGRADDVIVGFPDTAASTVAAYLGRDVFFPQGGRFGSYIIWDRRRSEPSRTLDELAADFAEAGRITILVLRTEPLPVVPPNMTLLRTFDAGVVIDEHYWLYELTLGPGRPD